MQRNNILIIIGAIFILSVIYVVWNQTSVVNDIFKQHRDQLQNEIKAIQEERKNLKKTIDSLDIRISIEQKDLLNDIDDILKKYGKK
jgi:peptidoglycan hydrolase CwlO-like protein